MKSIEAHRTNLADARQRVRNLTVLGMDPSLPPDKLAVVKNLERSARAEVELRQKALDHASQLPPDQETPQDYANSLPDSDPSQSAGPAATPPGLTSGSPEVPTI